MQVSHRFFRILFIGLITLQSMACQKEAAAQRTEDKIRLNQIGYYPQAEKKAVVMSEQASTFTVQEVASGEVVWKGTLGENRVNPYSKKISRIADFSGLQQQGNYVLQVDGMGRSYPFQIREQVHLDLTKAALKGFYYQRASTALTPEFAGAWARPAAHLDNHVEKHPSALLDVHGMPPTQPKLSAPIASPGGWYDAGDFNKYIVNSGITMGTLLSLYEDFPMMGRALEVHIPEQNNDLPDLLDEVLWNLRWMLTMQDPEDGGVYHKLTNAQFDGDVMPVQANKTRYVVQKSSAATLNFVAVLAQSARVFKPFEKQLPGLADSCQQAALRAWGWLGYNPNVHYDQDRLNQLTQPKVLTGAYGDQDVSDEWVWAAAELTVLMQDEKYLKGKNLEKPFVLPSWNQVRGLGYYTLIRSEFMQKHNPALVASLTEKVKGSAGDLIRKINAQPFHTAMGAGERDYVWGSNAVAANQGILLLQAYLRTQDQSFLNAAVGNLDYILGRNATGYCFVTGFGSKRVMHPHHRISMADQIKDPIPGLLSGGPNPGQQDKCKTYPNAFADESYTDDDCSYASNEIAINWNAPLVFLLAGIEGVMR